MKVRRLSAVTLDEFPGALQFRIADMATELEARSRNCYGGRACALDAKASDATRLCAMAKQFATDVGFRVANEAAADVRRNTAILPTMALRRSSVTFGCTRFWRARTRSCG